MRNTSTSVPSSEPIQETVPRIARSKEIGVMVTFGLIGWTLFVWVGRIRNVLLNDELVGWSRLWRSSLALSFVALALVTAVLLVKAVRAGSAPSGSTSVSQAQKAAGVLALYGIVVWFVRGADIVAGDHSAAFKAVHSVLAVVTITLGVVVLLRFVQPGRNL